MRPAARVAHGAPGLPTTPGATLPDVYLIDLARGPVAGLSGSGSAQAALVDLLNHELEAHDALEECLDEVILGQPAGGTLRAQDCVLGSRLPPWVCATTANRAGAGSDLALQMGVFGVASGYRGAAIVLGAGGERPAPVGRDWSAEVRWRYSPVAPAAAADFCVLRAGLDAGALAEEAERRAAVRDNDSRIGPLPLDSVLKGTDALGPSTSAWAPGNARPADGAAAAAALLAESSLLRRKGWTARCRLAAVETVSGDPAATWHRPVQAAEACLNRVQLRTDEIHLFQVDAPCGALPLALSRRLGVELDRINPDGDCLDTGRCAGAAALLQLARLVAALERRDQRFGLLLTATLDGHATAFLVDREFYL